MRVGFIGLGNVGAKLSGSLLRNGVDLYVHDLETELVAGFVARGARDGGSPAQLMQACDTVITCLPSPAACAAVMEQMLKKREGSTHEPILVPPEDGLLRATWNTLPSFQTLSPFLLS